MKNECHVVQDLLPLYAEGMLSDESVAFVKAHLETCEACRKAYEDEEPPRTADPEDVRQRTGEAGVLRILKKKLRKQTWCAIAITAAVVLLVTLLLRLNSIDYLIDVSATREYTLSDRLALLFKGDYSDRAEANAILSNVHMVFPYSEEELYSRMPMSREDIAYTFGSLLDYCVSEMDAGRLLTIYHVDLLSAHFGSSTGKMWVKYGFQRFDKTHDLSPYQGTGAIDHIALWKLEKRDDGYWRVTEIVSNAE